jgi:hypothetical protein
MIRGQVSLFFVSSRTTMELTQPALLYQGLFPKEVEWLECDSDDSFTAEIKNVGPVAPLPLQVFMA